MRSHVPGSAGDAYQGRNMAQQHRAPLTILRRKQVEAKTGYSRSTIYLRISQGLWPRQISLGARAVGWTDGEVAAMNAARIAGKSNAEIRALVAKLEVARQSADADTAFDTQA